jgi:hypothetical protein
VVVVVVDATVVDVDVDVAVTTVVVERVAVSSPDPLQPAAVRRHAMARVHRLTREGR